MMPVGTGLQVISSKNMTKEKTVSRSWRERLFSLPWRPLQKTKIVRVTTEDVFIDRQRSIVYCHPSLLNKVRNAIDTFGNKQSMVHDNKEHQT